MVMLIAFLAASSANPASSQTPDPPEIMENGEFPQDLILDQTFTERRLATVDGDDNGVNAAEAWWSISGTVFVPSDSTITWSHGGYSETDCLYTGWIHRPRDVF